MQILQLQNLRWPMVWKTASFEGRLFQRYEGCHILSIHNPLFFLGFDTDIAFKAQVRPADREND